MARVNCGRITADVGHQSRSSDGGRRRAVQLRWLLPVGLGFSYLIGAELSWRAFSGLAFFPPAGFTAAAMLLSPRRRWPALAATVVLCEAAIDIRHGIPLLFAVGYGAANAAEPMVGAWVFRRFTPDGQTLATRRQLAVFIAGPCLVGPIIGGSLLSLIRVVQDGGAWFLSAVHLFAGDAIAVVSIAGTLLMLHQARRPTWWWAELFGSALVMVAVSVAATATQLPTALVVLPAFLWAAFRLGAAGVSVFGTVFAFAANYMTGSGYGAFAQLDLAADSRLAVLQAFIAVLVVGSWFVGIEARDRQDERSARMRAESVASMAELTDSLLRQPTLDGIARVVHAYVEEHHDAGLVAIALRDPITGQVQAVPATLPDAVRSAVARSAGATTMPGAGTLGPTGPVWYQRPDEFAEGIPVGDELVSLWGAGAFGVLPLRSGEEARGALIVAWRGEKTFGIAEREHLEAVSQSVGHALERAELFEAERTARFEAQRLFDQLEKEAARLRESELRFQLLADQSPLMIWVHDAGGDQEWVNQTFCTFFGVKREDMRTNRWQVFMHPADAEQYVDAFASAVAGHQPFHARARVRRADGAWRWIESWGRPRFDPTGLFLGHVGSSADVTDSHEAEAELAAAHAFTQELTALVPGVISVFDLDAGRDVFLSRQSYQSLGYEPEEVFALGSGFLASVLHPDDAASVGDHLAAARTLTDNEPATVEYQFRRKDGSWRWLRTTSVPLRRTITGAVGQVANLTIDVTDQKAHEAKLHAAAALEAYGARLADALRDLDRAAAVASTATQLLSSHLEGTEAHVLVLDGTSEFAARLEASSVDGRPRRLRQLDRYGWEIVRRARSGEVVVIDDVATDERLSAAERRAISKLRIGAAVVQPLAQADRTDHLLVVCRREPRAWSEDELAAIATTADRSAQAAQRARTIADQRRQREHAALLAEVITALNTSQNTTKALQRVADLLVPAVGDYATFEQTLPGFELLGGAHRDPDLLPALRALREQHHLRAGDTQSASRASPSREPRQVPAVSIASQPEYGSDPATAALVMKLTLRSHVTVPVQLSDERRGALLIGLSDPDRDAFTAGDLLFLADLGQRVEVALAARNVRDAEHHIAVTLQKALLPDRVRWDPAAAIEARYRAASDLLRVGGDWYDTFAWQDGSVGVMVGDVVGHSLESAAAMGRLRAAAAALAADGEPSPARLLDALDRFARSPDGTAFATAACVVLQPSTGVLTYASAGHPPPLLITPRGAAVHLLDARSSPLSAYARAPRAEASVTIEAGSVVTLYSDGLVERRGESMDAGLARLESALLRRIGEPTSEIIDGVINELTTTPAQDDIVVAAFRYTPALAELHLRGPAHSGRLAQVRQQVRAWLTDRRVPADERDALLIAVGEACTNVIDHAYRSPPRRRSRGPGRPVEPLMLIELADHGDEVVARVTDHGLWRQPGGHSQDRGRGTLVMKALTSHYERHTTEHGTTVTLAVPAAARLPAAGR